jgi:hypothetical protein
MSFENILDEYNGVGEKGKDSPATAESHLIASRHLCE